MQVCDGRQITAAARALEHHHYRFAATGLGSAVSLSFGKRCDLRDPGTAIIMLSAARHLREFALELPQFLDRWAQADDDGVSVVGLTTTCLQGLQEPIPKRPPRLRFGGGERLLVRALTMHFASVFASTCGLRTKMGLLMMGCCWI